MIFCGLFVSILKMQTPSESTMQNGLIYGCNSDTPNFFMILIYILEWNIHLIFLKSGWNHYSFEEDLKLSALFKGNKLEERRLASKLEERSIIK